MFHLPGSSDQPQLDSVLLILSAIDIVTLTENTMIRLVPFFVSKLFTPKSLFLSNFSFLGLCFMTIVVPRMSRISRTQRKQSVMLSVRSMSIYIAMWLTSTECVLQKGRACDPASDICWPLLYGLVMHPKFLWQLPALAYICGFMVFTI